MSAPTMTISIDHPPTTEEGYAVGRSESITIDIPEDDVVSPEQMKIALKDAELMLGLLRDRPDEMRSLYNDVVAGRSDAVKETSARIGLSESAFREKGGGMWPYILGVGVVIMGCVITDNC